MTTSTDRRPRTRGSRRPRPSADGVQHVRAVLGGVIAAPIALGGVAGLEGEDVGGRRDQH